MGRRAKTKEEAQQSQEIVRQGIRAALGLLERAIRLQQIHGGGRTREVLWTRGGVVYVVSEAYDSQGKLLRAVVVERYEIPMTWGEDLYGSHDGQGRWVEDQDAVVLEWEVEP